MEITVSQRDDFTVLGVEGRMDAVTAPQFEAAFKENLAGGANKFVVDLSMLEYISSAGLRSMLVMAKSLKASSGVSVLCGLKDVVQEVFKISGFNSIFTICETVDEAVKAG